MWRRTEDEQLIAVNTFCWERKEVVRLPVEGGNEKGDPHGQGIKNLVWRMFRLFTMAPKSVGSIINDSKSLGC